MKVFRNKKTGRLGETQFGEDAEVLIRNARQYCLDDEIEIIDMTPQEYNENSMSKEQKDEIKIKIEMDKILREQAIANLKAKGEL